MQRITMSDGSVYEGDSTDGVPEGHGRMVFPNGEYYVGMFSKGRMCGKGTYHWPDGDSFEGEYRDGRRSGLGEYRWANGDVYCGEFRDGFPSGRGIFRCSLLEFPVREVVSSDGMFREEGIGDVSEYGMRIVLRTEPTVRKKDCTSVPKRYCHVCGSAIQLTYSFCPNCGNRQ